MDLEILPALKQGKRIFVATWETIFLEPVGSAKYS